SDLTPDLLPQYTKEGRIPLLFRHFGQPDDCLGQTLLTIVNSQCRAGAKSDLAQVTGNHVARADFAQRRNVDPASRLRIRAARVESTARRRIDRARDIALQQ